MKILLKKDCWATLNERPEVPLLLRKGSVYQITDSTGDALVDAGLAIQIFVPRNYTERPLLHYQSTIEHLSA